MTDTAITSQEGEAPISFGEALRARIREKVLADIAARDTPAGELTEANATANLARYHADLIERSRFTSTLALMLADAIVGDLRDQREERAELAAAIAATPVAPSDALARARRDEDLALVHLEAAAAITPEAATLAAVTSALRATIPLTRQVFGIDAGPEGSATSATVLARLHREVSGHAYMPALPAPPTTDTGESEP